VRHGKPARITRATVVGPTAVTETFNPYRIQKYWILQYFTVDELPQMTAMIESGIEFEFEQSKPMEIPSSVGSTWHHHQTRGEFKFITKNEVQEMLLLLVFGERLILESEQVHYD
jgi:hypothetical protein